MSARIDPGTPLPPPEWFGALLGRVPSELPEPFRSFAVPDGVPTRDAAVLILLGEGPDGPDVLLTERAATLSSHAAQVSFPGGRQEPTDEGPVAAALREAVEETGLDPLGVQVMGTMPALHLAVSRHQVTPVLAWWAAPSPVEPVDAGEVAGVVRVPIAELADPANRRMVRSPRGFATPAFLVRDLTVWGFTAGLLTWVLTLGGWERPWDATEVADVPLPGLGPVAGAS